MKNKLRQNTLQKRNQLKIEEIVNKSRNILNLLKTFQNQLLNKNIFIFIDFKNEVQTIEIIQYLQTLNCNIFIPRVNIETKEMDIYPYTSHKDLLESKYGILEPQDDPSQKINAEILNIVLTPGVAFDLKGYRIGYGGGFYDRLFEKIGKNVLKIALGFELQITNEIPVDSFDLPVDYLITENKIYDFTI